MFNFKAFSLLLVALAFGVGAAVFANQWLQQQVGTRVVEEAVDRTPILVATRDIEYGQPIEEIDFKVVEWPIEVAPAGAIGVPEEAIGRIANQRLLAGEPLMRARVVEQLVGSTLSTMIKPHMRAITVRVNDVAGVAGFLLPGNHVDVLGSRSINGRMVTKTVLQNVKVLAIDQKANPDKDEPAVVRAVTLEANLDDSITLVSATQEGPVQLVLRNPEDLATRVYAEPQAAVRTPRRAAPTVRIIRGTALGRTAISN